MDDQAQIISYEEDHPYGSTAYQAVRNKTETPKRYRYTGKERDEETGLYITERGSMRRGWGGGRSTDPIGLGDGVNKYGYCAGNPISKVDKMANKPGTRRSRLRTTVQAMHDGSIH